MNSDSPVKYGELRPVGGGDLIPLLKPKLIVGRRESCDIVLRFPNVSGTHCELSIVDDKWRVKDLNSTNGVKVNDELVIEESSIDSGDKLSIGKHKYEIRYESSKFGNYNDSCPRIDIFKKSLLESAGLEHQMQSRKEANVKRYR
jgi:adenylate cyclase